jgi:hypothetical protein
VAGGAGAGEEEGGEEAEGEAPTPGQYNDIAFNIGVVVKSILIVVVPVAASLLTLNLVRRLRKYEPPTARGFEVKPLSTPPHEP